MDARRIVDSLGGTWNGSSGKCLCPAHGDRTPSLSVSEKNGKVLVKCFAGCSQEAVIRELKSRGLWPETKPQRDLPQGIPYAWNGKKYVGHWRYNGEEGQLIGYEVRYENDDGEKDVIPFFVPTNGEFKWGYPKHDGYKRPLYNLPELKDADTVWVLEGPKCCDLAWQEFGLTVTTSPGGSGGAAKADWSPLAGKNVIIWPDKDIPGFRYAKSVLGILQKLDAPPRSLYIVEVQKLKLPEGGDIEQWLEAGGKTIDGLSLREIRCISDLIVMALDAGDQKFAEELFAGLRQSADEVRSASAEPLKGITARKLQNMDIAEPEWIVQGIIPTGLTLLAGKPKSGKSYLMINLASQLAAGGKVFDAVEAERTRVLYLGLEDPHWRIKKRLEEILGDGHEWPDNLHFFASGEWPKLHQGGMAKLNQAVQERPDTKLIVIDTLQKVRPPGKSKGNLYSEDYQALEKLQEFASKHNVGVVVVHHTKKSRENEAFDEISGSTGLTGATDTNMVFRKVPGPEQNIRQLHYQGRETGEGMLELTFENHRFRLVDAPKAEESSRRISRQREAILHVLGDQWWPPCEMSRADLVAAVGKNVGKGIDAILENMVANGEIIKPRRGFYMHPDHAIRLRANEMMMKAARDRRPGEDYISEERFIQKLN